MPQRVPISRHVRSHAHVCHMRMIAALTGVMPSQVQNHADRSCLVMLLSLFQLYAGDDNQAESQLSLEEWLQLEAESWDSSDEDDPADELTARPDDEQARISAAHPGNTAPQDASSSGGGSEASWAAGLPFKVKPGEQQWDGEVPPDVVVLAPPQRDADGNLLLPPGVQQLVTDPQPAAKQPAAAPRKLQQQAAQAQEDGPQQGQQQKQKQPWQSRRQSQQPQQQQQRVPGGGRAASGSSKKGGGRGNTKKGPANTPPWMRNLPPSE